VYDELTDSFYCDYCGQELIPAINYSDEELEDINQLKIYHTLPTFDENQYLELCGECYHKVAVRCKECNQFFHVSDIKYDLYPNCNYDFDNSNQEEV